MFSKFIQTLSQLPVKSFIGVVKCYRFLISPWLGQCCRFYPSCSQYAEQALREWGFIRGSFLVIWRLLRCHPLCQGGVDHVPASNGKNI